MKSRQLVGEVFASEDRTIFYPDDPQYDQISLPYALTAGKLVDKDKVRVDISGFRNNGKVKIKSIQVLARDREVICIVNEDQKIVPLHEIGPKEISLHRGDGQSGQHTEKTPLHSGDTVAVRLLKPQKKADIVTGELIKVLDKHKSIDVEIEIILCALDIPHRWSQEVLAEASTTADVNLSECPPGREDLRDIDFVTIDGESAKDFDDAIFCEREKTGWHIMVAIADVASYVKPGGPLDKEALERGNSVYFPKRVVSMLPPALSDNACSLRPHQDRLVLVCSFHLSAEGVLKKHRFFPALIRSKARLTYTKVNEFFTEGLPPPSCSDSVHNMLLVSREAFVKLLEQRKIRGALELEMEETRLVYDKHGNVSSIIRETRNDAHRLIEEFMICANVCAADFLGKHQKALPYRVHGGLKEDIFEKFRAFFRKRAISRFEISSQGLSELIDKLSGNDRRIMQMLILRFLSKALYQTDNIGHFGLALDQYTHFTSPIRRYSDLIVHRLIHYLLKTGAGVAYQKKEVDRLGNHLCLTEQRANEAVYSIDKYLKCHYIDEHIGKTFSGTIISVVPFGLFIMLDDIHVEGLLHISQLKGDYYELAESQQSLIGRKHKQVYTLGDHINVKLKSVDPEERRIDLILAES